MRKIQKLSLGKINVAVLSNNHASKIVGGTVGQDGCGKTENPLEDDCQGQNEITEDCN